MNRIQQLEAKSVFILREAYRSFKNKNMAMLWSIGKDSTVLLTLAKKAFYGNIPFPLIHVDTSYKIPAMIEYRNNIALKNKFDLIYGQNVAALENKETFPDGKVDRLTCCKNLKSSALKNTLSGAWPIYRLNHQSKKFDKVEKSEPFNAVIAGIRSDEEGSRSKERYFSLRSAENNWNIAEQPPEIWNHFNNDFPPGSHIRIHPLLDWTELDIWEYIRYANIEVIDLYFAKNGKRYRSLGCSPCTSPIDSNASNVDEIIEELKTDLKFVAERSGREQDKDDGGSLETLRREGYM